MVASKYDGLRDPRSGQVYDYRDILAEHQRLRERLTDVRLIKGSDTSMTKTDAMWITYYDHRFPTRQAARAWCAGTFSGLSGQALDTACTPRDLKRP